jgi:APA family basic amino acid/polyamine antiporter
MDSPDASPVEKEALQGDRLKRKIGLFGLTLIAAGSCIGSGIFITPSDVAHQLGDANAILLVWTLGGVVAVTGSLTFAELSGRFPQAGGVYVFIRESFGKLWAFLYGWSILTVITSGAIAALSLTFARYLTAFVPLSSNGQIVVGISAIVTVTAINILGVKPADVFSSVSTLFKLLGITGIIVIGIYAGNQMGDTEAFTGAGIAPKTTIGAFALAMIGVIWSYGGWHHASYVAGEVQSAAKVVPRAMILGALIVTMMYVLANWAYLRLLPLDQLASSQAVAADAVRSVHQNGAYLIAGLIAISTFGSIGIFTLTAPRIYYKMAEDGAFFRKIALLHPTRKTPIAAILLQSGWAIVLLLLWATFENLITYVVFMDWVFMTMAALSIFYFRKKYRNTETTGFIVPLYPIIPFIFIGISTWFIIYTLIGKPEQAIAGIILLIIGLPVYLLSKKQA